MSRFRIVISPGTQHPWELQEWRRPPRWFTRGRWHYVYRGDTKDAAEKHMMGIVEGEGKTAPTYYDSFGNPDNY